MQLLNFAKQDAHQLVRHAKRHATKIRPKAVAGGIYGRFGNFDQCQSEVAGDVISGVAVDVRATFGKSELNGGRIILLIASRIRFTHHSCAVFSWILQTTGSN